jgi:hypothetical protein
MQGPLLAKLSTDLARFQDDLENAHRQGRAAFDRLFDAPPEGLTVHEIDTHKVIVRASAQHFAVLGYRPE